MLLDLHCCRAADSAILRWNQPASDRRPTADPSSLEQRLGLTHSRLVGERFDIIPATKRIDHVRNAGLVGEYLLRPKGDRTASRSGRERFVHRVRVQRLCSASTAANAWYATRTTLFIGCCAVSVTPAVCEWNRMIHDRGDFAP
jgi:hypothetical protein